MKICESWLREWVNPTIRTDQLTAQLTMAGLEVDAVTPVAEPFSNIVIGQIVTIEPHPHADRLRLCKVNTGTDEILDIICGANNAHVGLKAPTAKLGAKLPSGLVIKATKLRGIESFGMLCSASELGLAEASDTAGLMVLDNSAPVGQDLRDYLQLDDVTIELDLTPNRGDCLSVYGVAREIGAINRCDVKPLRLHDDIVASDQELPVNIEVGAACPRYIGRVITGFDNTALTPTWMRERLRRCGLRSLGVVIDITNYVLLELGQPMHAFDIDRIDGGISVRFGKDGESLTLLDGKTVTLDTKTLVIADNAKPLALAGVMGGVDSAVSATTHNLFFESAFFTPLTMAGVARRYGLHTDSSHRFERGVDPTLPLMAMQRATQLLLEIAGGNAGPITAIAKTSALPEYPQIKLRSSRIKRILGLDVNSQQTHEILIRLGFAVTSQDDYWLVTPPSYRFDIVIEEDLIEEIARIIGYDALPMAQSFAVLGLSPQPETVLPEEKIKDILCDRDYNEIITYSFVDPQLQQKLTSGLQPITLANPIAVDMSEMRTSLWPGLIQAATYNKKRQQTRIRLFESGLIFYEDNGKIKQETMIAGCAMGPVFTKQWGLTARNIDFFDVKADIEAILKESKQLERFSFAVGEHCTLHPGQTAQILCDGKVIGWQGMLHPRLEKQLGLEHVVLFELQLDKLKEARIPSFEPLSKYPSVCRDIAIVLNEDVTYACVRQCVADELQGLTYTLTIFDVYRGESLDPNQKSLALGLVLQDPSRTLNDQEADDILKKLIDKLKTDLGATLRV